MRIFRFRVFNSRLFLCICCALCYALVALPAFAQTTSGISAPAPGSAVSGDAIIQGTAVIEPFQKYELHYKIEPNSDDAYIYFDGGTSPVVNGALGIWRTTGLAPGVYSLRLRVVKQDGNYAEYYTQNLNVNLGPVEPTPTPTSSEPTPTPIPTSTFTPAPPPTPVIGEVAQPQITADALPAATETQAAGNGVVEAVAQPLPRPSPNAGAATGQSLGALFSLDQLRQQFWQGVRYSAAICIGLLALFAGRQVYSWSRRRFR